MTARFIGCPNSYKTRPSTYIESGCRNPNIVERTSINIDQE
jgi:hypothetical protein